MIFVDNVMVNVDNVMICVVNVMVNVDIFHKCGQCDDLCSEMTFLSWICCSKPRAMQLAQYVTRNT